MSPWIDGDKIVWSDSRGGINTDDIYMYDLATQQETQLTSYSGWELTPTISGNKFVWVDNRNGEKMYMDTIQSAPADTTPPTGTIQYSTTDPTDQAVTATLTPSEPVTITNNGGSPTYTFTENGSFTFEFADSAGNTGTAVATVTNINRAPAVGAVTPSVNPVQINSAANINANFTDPDTQDTHTAVIDWGDGTTSAGTVNESSGSGSVQGNHSYTTPGVYTIKVTVTDNNGGVGESSYQYIAVYDSEGGFVTGGGTIDSPPGSFAGDVTLTGKANFGFVSKYQKGAQTPSGQTQFRFNMANLDFKSSSYDWLVVSGARAQFKGKGTINGTGDYGFILTAIDGQKNGGGVTDKFRIKIWDKSSGNVVYDNQMGMTDTSDPNTILSGGSIVIH